jgi:predicted Zn-dependent peptidase
MPDAESVVTGAWVGVGTRDEPREANGVAHLVEHMMFKGTKSRSAYALSTAIENRGGSMNAHTSREETAYYARMLPGDTDLALEIISDMLQNSAFDAKELDREKQVVIQEIGRDIDSPEDYALDLMNSLAYPRQKIGRPILGTAKVIEGMPRRALKDYVKSYYTAANTVIIAAGRIAHAEFVEMAKKHFGHLRSGLKQTRRDVPKISAGAKYSERAIEQLHFLLGFAGPSFHSRHIHAAQLLSIVLGGSASSRLFQKVREKRGLVYSVNSAQVSYSDTGMFQIYAGTDPARIRELIPAVCDELQSVTSHVTKSELDRAKAQVRADILMGKESVSRRAEVLGHQILSHGKPIMSSKILHRMENTDVDAIHGMATKLLREKPIVTALGPLADMEDYGRIAERVAL